MVESTYKWGCCFVFGFSVRPSVKKTPSTKESPCGGRDERAAASSRVYGEFSPAPSAAVFPSPVANAITVPSGTGDSGAKPRCPKLRFQDRSNGLLRQQSRTTTFKLLFEFSNSSRTKSNGTVRYFSDDSLFSVAPTGIR